MTRTHCRHGHDLTVRGATYSNGSCRRCQVENRRRKARGLPPLPLPPSTTCKRGHDLTLPEARLGSGKCRACYDAARMEDRAVVGMNIRIRQDRKKPHAPPEDLSAESLRTNLLLEWDLRIEREPRQWVKTELRQQRDAALAALSTPGG